MALFTHNRIAKISCLVMFLVWAGLLTYKYYHFNYYDWDFAFFAQAMYGLTHGSTFVSLFGVNFFSNHANLIAYGLVPLYKVFPHPLTLLVLKLVSFFAASYVFYLMAKERLGERLALCMLWFYWAYPPNIYGLIYEFDFENLAPAFLMLMFYFYLHGRWPAFMVSSILLMLIKENMPLIAAAFGVYGLFTKQDKLRWGVLPAGLGFVFFYVLAFVFVPFMGRHGLGQHPYMAHYQEVLHSPWQIFQALLTSKNVEWMQNLLAPFVFLPLLAIDMLIPVLPIILQHLLSVVQQEHSIYFAYSMTIAPFMAMALLKVLHLIKLDYGKKMFGVVLALVFVSTTAFLIVEFRHFKPKYLDYPKDPARYWQLIAMVPPQAPVIATFNFLPELSQRPYLYAFHKVYSDSYQKEDYSFKVPDHVRYALVDYANPWMQKALEKHRQLTIKRVEDFVDSGGWSVRKKYRTLVLYER